MQLDSFDEQTNPLDLKMKPFNVLTMLIQTGSSLAGIEVSSTTVASLVYKPFKTLM